MMVDKRRAASKGFRHHLTADDLLELLEAQHGKCPGCGRNLEDGSYVIDHDHACCPGRYSCGRCVRGLLCPNCNLAVGQAGDDPGTLRRLAAWLEANTSCPTQSSPTGDHASPPPTDGIKPGSEAA